MKEPRKAEVGDVLMDKNGYRFEVISTGIHCNPETGLSFAWIEVIPIFYPPKGLFTINLDMSLEKYVDSWDKEFLIFQSEEEIKRKAGFKPDDEKYILWGNNLEYVGRREILEDILKDFIKEMPFNLDIGKLKEFNNRFRNVTGIYCEDDSERMAFYISNEIENRLKELEEKKPISSKSIFIQDKKPD